jgi:hypothetical protein
MKFGTWNVRKKSIYGRFAHGSCEINIKILVRFSGSTRGQMGQQANIYEYFSMERGMKIMN